MTEQHTGTIGTKKVTGRLVIPSGIRCTRASTIDWCFRNVPSIGIVTTKSISLMPRAGYVEPIFARYAPGSYINAVGLSNPGAEKFAEELRGIRVPGDKFLLVSIFGGNLEQFVETAGVLKDVADGFELNMSCPHAEGYGVEIGQKKDLVAEITAAVVQTTGKPVFVKLSAGVLDLGGTAVASIQAGAVGITVSNTVGPATVNLGGTPLLSNKVGGLSGAGIRPLALRSVARVREAVGPKPVILGMGGVSEPQDVADFIAAGANYVGIGSVLTGMDSAVMQAYCGTLEVVSDPVRHSVPAPFMSEVAASMEYAAARVVERVDYHEGLFKLVLDQLPGNPKPGELAGKYYFLTVPGVGEKPFAIFCAEERSIVVRTAGRFTTYLAGLREGAEVYLRGPYGKPFPTVTGREVVMLGGGTGIASLLEIGKRLAPANKQAFLLGGRNGRDLFDLEKFKMLGEVRVSTDDGSQGMKGYVSDLLKQWLSSQKAEARRPLFVACGPEPMVHACFKLLTHLPDEDVWAAIEYHTSCGVGICGKCASPSGALTCIDGPFLPRPHFERARAEMTV